MGLPKNARSFGGLMIVEYLRCKVQKPNGPVPEKNNAIILVAENLGARVLIDYEEKTEFYNWGWITFEPSKISEKK